MSDQILAAFAVLPNYLSQHIVLSVAALVLGGLISFPLAIATVRHPALRTPVLTIASLIQTIPGLALLALFYPLLLAISTVTTSTVGVKIPALGFLPSLAALTLYAMLPILRNTVTGLTGVNATIVEAAKGVGMTPLQRLLRVEIPIAAPVIMAGVRTSAVWTIGAATLATPVGQTSLGNYIFSGLQTENWIFVLFGCAASAALALAVDLSLGLVENGTAARDRRKVFLGVGVIALGTLVATAPALLGKAKTYVVGAKNFSEQYILAELMARRIRDEGASVELREGLGSAIAFRALASGDIDAYVDYSGTLWTNVMGRKDTPPRDAMLAELTRWMKDNHGVVVLGSLGFENAYVLAMRKARAQSLGIQTIDDLAGQTNSLTLGADIEFLDRPEWRALRDAYSLRFKDQKSYNPTFMYRALGGGDVDVISAFSSDGRIAADNLVVLGDPRHAAPSYDAIILVSPKRANDALLKKALQPLVGSIAVEAMRTANYSVDRDDDKHSPGQAARELDDKSAAKK